MALGVFDPTAVPEGWFDETTQAVGWFDADLLDAQAAAENSSRGLTAAFQTRAIRSRRHQQALWIASLAPAQQAAVVPVSAWMGRPVARRRSLKRTLLQVDPLQWQYIAPTVAAILRAAKVIKIEFRRRLQESPPLDYYPPPTGPPSEDWTLAAPFETRRIRSRRFVKTSDVLGVGPASAPVIPYIEPAAALKRRETIRKLRAVEHCPSYPQTPVPGVLPAIATAQRKRRKGRAGLFLSGGGAPLYQEATGQTTAAVFPSFVQTGYHKRSETKRRLQRVLDAPVYPQADVSVSADRAIAESFKTTRLRSRKLQKAPDVLGATAAEAPPLQFAATVAVKIQKRRRARQGLFLSGGASLFEIVATVPDVVGELQADGTTTLEGAGFVVAVFTEYSSTVEAGKIIRQEPVGGSLASSGSTVNIYVSLGARAQESGGGWEFYLRWEQERARRRKKRKELEELEAERERIADEQAREIALFLQAQEAADNRRDELARLSRLVAAHQAPEADPTLSPRVQKAIQRAAEKQTTWALDALERELKRQADEEEEFLIQMMLLTLDD